MEEKEIEITDEEYQKNVENFKKQRENFMGNYNPEKSGISFTAISSDQNQK